jgi:hypothetical protein
MPTLRIQQTPSCCSERGRSVHGLAHVPELSVFGNLCNSMVHRYGSRWCTTSVRLYTLCPPHVASPNLSSFRAELLLCNGHQIPRNVT